jgi:hypothetical protein
LFSFSDLLFCHCICVSGAGASRTAVKKAIKKLQ